MILRLEKVAKLFGGFAALRDATADFEAGKLYLITGENGAGKSTLLRLIAGLMAPSRGRIVWDSPRRAMEGHGETPESREGVTPRLKAGVYPGRERVGVGAHTTAGGGAGAAERASLGYMAHATMLYDELSGMENLRYFAKLYGVGDGPCEAAMRTVGLDEGLKRPVAQYSQGMRQRLALARAILHSPALLLLDEPFSNLDAGSAQHMVEVLAGQRDRGMCVLLVTHQASLLTNVADCHLHISGGVLRQVAMRAEVFE